MNDEKRNDVSNKLMDAAKCISKDDVACVLNDALHGEKKLSGINENCSTCCSVSLTELADLVKPSCDREALLALADDLEKKADKIVQAAQDSRFTGLGPRMCKAKHEACKWRGIARRIREACGHRIVGKGEPTWL